MEATKVKLLVLLMLIMTTLMTSSKLADAQMDCRAVSGRLSQCLQYLTQGSPVPVSDGPCCSAVRGMYDDASTTQQRQDLCACLKTDAVNYNLNDDAMRNLPSDCGLHLSFVISRDIDCATIP